MGENADNEREEQQVARCAEVLRSQFGDDWLRQKVEEMYDTSVADLDAQDISGLALDAPLPSRDKTDLFFELLRVLPTYGMLMLWELPAEEGERAHFWDRVREGLDGEDEPLAEALMYWLWVDWFEASDRVEEAWREATASDPGELRTRRLMESSGPIPWSLKAPTLFELADDPRWHLTVYQALSSAMFDVYGSTDREAASELLGRLDLDERDVPGLRSTRWAYETMPPRFHNWTDYETRGKVTSWYRWEEDGELHEQPGPFPLAEPGVDLLPRIKGVFRRGGG